MTAGPSVAAPYTDEEWGCVAELVALAACVLLASLAAAPAALDPLPLPGPAGIVRAEASPAERGCVIAAGDASEVFLTCPRGDALSTVQARVVDGEITGARWTGSGGWQLPDRLSPWTRLNRGVGDATAFVLSGFLLFVIRRDIRRRNRRPVSPRGVR